MTDPLKLIEEIQAKLNELKALDQLGRFYDHAGNFGSLYSARAFEAARG